jgi:predicted transcriptional regulator
MAREMRIGIAAYEEFKQHTITIAKGEHKPDNDEPTIWFESIESMAQILSSKNQELLKKIRDNNPQSMKEAADMSGRHPSNLSRTLKNLEKYGIVKLNREKGAVKPQLCVETFNATFSLANV